MGAERSVDPWIQAAVLGVMFVIVYVSIGTLLFNEALRDSVLLGGIGAVVFTFVYGVFLNRQR